MVPLVHGDHRKDDFEKKGLGGTFLFRVRSLGRMSPVRGLPGRQPRTKTWWTDAGEDASSWWGKKGSKRGNTGLGNNGRV